MMVDYRDKIKVVGFDLDQTLYPKSPEIDEAIQGYLYKKITEHKGCSLTEAEKLFKDLYKDGRGISGSKTLIELGLPRAKELVQEALEKADIDKFLKPDRRIPELLKKIRNKYGNIDLLTGSDKENCFKKLKKLSIPAWLFSNIITANDASKSDGEAYKLWFSLYPDLKSENFLYVGDRVSSDYEIPKSFGISAILVNIKEKDASVDCPQIKTVTGVEKYLL